MCVLMSAIVNSCCYYFCVRLTNLQKSRLLVRHLCCINYAVAFVILFLSKCGGLWCCSTAHVSDVTLDSLVFSSTLYVGRCSLVVCCARMSPIQLLGQVIFHVKSCKVGHFKNVSPSRVILVNATKVNMDYESTSSGTSLLGLLNSFFSIIEARLLKTEYKPKLETFR